MKKYVISIGKPEQGCINEDAALLGRSLLPYRMGQGVEDFLLRDGQIIF